MTGKKSSQLLTNNFFPQIMHQLVYIQDGSLLATNLRSPWIAWNSGIYNYMTFIHGENTMQHFYNGYVDSIYLIYVGSQTLVYTHICHSRTYQSCANTHIHTHLYVCMYTHMHPYHVPHHACTETHIHTYIHTHTHTKLYNTVKFLLER